MRVGVDIDGVMANTFVHALGRISAVTGADHHIEGVSDYDFSDLHEVMGFNPHKFFMEHVYSYGLDIPAISGAVDGVKRMRDSGHEIYFVTGRNDQSYMRYITREWLDRQGLEGYYEGSFFGGMFSKLELIREHGIDLLLDDAPNHTQQMAENLILSVVMTQPYNRHVKEVSGLLYRAENMLSIPEEVFSRRVA